MKLLGLVLDDIFTVSASALTGGHIPIFGRCVRVFARHTGSSKPVTLPALAVSAALAP